MAETVGAAQPARPIRFGIMCRGAELAAWEAKCVRTLLAVEGVELALLIVDDRPPERPAQRRRLAGMFNPKTLLWRIYQRAVLNRKSRSTRFEDLSVEFAGVPVIRCRPVQSGKFVQRFSTEDVAAIEGQGLDFVLRFAFNILRGDVLTAARHGIWSFHHDDPDLYRGKPPGFWEIYKGDPVTGVILQRLTERLDAGVILHRGYFATKAVSYVDSRDTIFFGAADWPARLCRELQAGVATAVDTPALSTTAPIYRTPNSLHMLRFFCLWLRQYVAHHYSSIFRVQQWSVGVIDRPVAEVAGLTGSSTIDDAVRSARWMPEPPDRFLADPFAVERDDGEGLTILAEDFDWRIGRGSIATITYRPDAAFSQPEPVIRTDWHLSYPYLLRHEGETYCLPEMNEARTLSLYRADAGLTSWTKVATLLDGVPIVDATLFQHDGRWWLFGTREDEGANLKLFAWFAADLLGDWTPHLANPLKTDVRSSRPAGKPFVHAGELYRPAQDCSTGYGAAIVVNRIVELSPERFLEEPIGRIAPDRAGHYPLGLHTICGAGGRTVIDGSRSAFERAEAANAIRKKFRRLLPR